MLVYGASNDSLKDRQQRGKNKAWTWFNILKFHFCFYCSPLYTVISDSTNIPPNISPFHTCTHAHTVLAKVLWRNRTKKILFYHLSIVYHLSTIYMHFYVSLYLSIYLDWLWIMYMLYMFICIKRFIIKNLLCPSLCGSVDWVSACEPKGPQCDSQSGHTPGCGLGPQ